MAKKDGEPAADKKPLFIALALVFGGLTWMIYSINPNHMFRAETVEERKAREQEEREEKKRKADEAKRPKGFKGGHH